MKRIVIYVLLITMAFQGFYRWVVYINFQLNREYIAKNLCVKKEVKNNCCQGSCQLRKKLGEDDNPKNSSQNNQIKIEQEFWIISNYERTFKIMFFDENQRSKSFSYKERMTIGVQSSHFRPPTKIS